MEDTGDVVVVGTAHVSERSAEEVRRAIKENDPDVVAVELDSARYESLVEGDRSSRYGADMAAAIEEAEDQDVPIALIDREITTTLKRLWSEMTVLERLKMAGALVAGAFGVGTASVEELEEAIEDGSVDEHVDDLRSFSPGGARTLIDERDAYMADRLLDLAEDGDVVAVVGAGHRKGIEGYLEEPEEIPELPAAGRVVEVDADLYESGDSVLVVFDLPGCDESEIDVVYSEGAVQVEARPDEAPEPGYHHVSGGSDRSFEGSAEVPVDVDADGASASYDLGVLEIELPKQR